SRSSRSSSAVSARPENPAPAWKISSRRVIGCGWRIGSLFLAIDIINPSMSQSVCRRTGCSGVCSAAFRRKQFVYQALPPEGGTTNSISVYVYKLIQIDNRVAKIAQRRRFRLFIFALRISIGLRLHKRQRPFHLIRVRRAVQSDLEPPDDLGAAICARLFRDRIGEKPRLLDHEFIVHQRQRLWRDGRDGARRPRDDGRRAIEDLDQRQQDRAFDEYVDAAPPCVVIILRVERPARARAGV